ncbi:MAG: iron-containing alcohol dehydrogenase [Firmicutes bacterium]|nr:iron-containing alcohol dehydrogenase [Bacillota bacterium]
MNYEILIPERTICRPGALREIGTIMTQDRAGQLFSEKVFIVTSSFLTAYVDSAVASLEAEGYITKVGSYVDVEPEVATIDDLTAEAREFGAGIVVGSGGGSVLDTSKAVALMLGNEGSVRKFLMDERAFGMFEKRGVYSVCVPTTAGTGSEASPCSVIKNLEAKVKPNMLHQFLLADLALLDPELLLSLPKPLVASTGFDALTHAVESYVSLWSNPITRMYSMMAIKLVSGNLEKFVTADDLAAAGALLAGSNLAGTAMNAATGMAHGIGQAVGAVYGIAHGDAMAILLPISMELNLDHAEKAYAEVATALGVEAAGRPDREVALEGIAEVRRLAAAVGVKQSLRQLGVTSKERFPEVLQSVHDTIKEPYCNPRPLSDDLVMAALEKALG